MWDEGDHLARCGSVRRQTVLPVSVSDIRTVWSVGIMNRLSARIAKQLAEFRNHNIQPDYEEQARIILLIVNEERQAEIREWRAKQTERTHRP